MLANRFTMPQYLRWLIASAIVIAASLCASPPDGSSLTQAARMPELACQKYDARIPFSPRACATVVSRASAVLASSICPK